MAGVKQQVRERDGNRCVDCGMTAAEQREYYGRGLHVHRVNPGSPYTLPGCVSLCTCCHMARHGAVSFCKPKRYTCPEPGKVVSFRLDRETVVNLDRIARWLDRTCGGRHGHAGALRFALRDTVRDIRSVAKTD